MPRKKKQDPFFEEVDQKFAFLITDFGFAVADRRYAAAFEGLCIVEFSGPVRLRVVRDRGYTLRVDFTASDEEWHQLEHVVECIENKVDFFSHGGRPDLTQLSATTQRNLPRIINFFGSKGEARLKEFWKSRREYILKHDARMTRFVDGYGYKQGDLKPE